jgi:hypothetical protein
MAPLALVGATSLTNAACDPAPSPVCENSRDWSSYVSSHASWGEDHGNRIVVLDLRVSNGELGFPTAYTIVGGSLLTVGKSDQLKIKPDDGATVITLQGAMVCDGFKSSVTIKITIALVPPDGGSFDDTPIVKVSL